MFSLISVILSSLYSQNYINYSESNDVYSNPERGLQKYSITNSNYHTKKNYSNLSQSELENWRISSDKITVLFRYFLLSDFVNGSSISQNYLENIQKDFDIIRNAGLKCVVRFSYSDSQSTSAQQPTKSQILNHISQLNPILQANKDVILTHQAGFIGTWGEWYYTNSSEFGNEENINTTQWNNRKEIIDAMLNATPTEIPLQVRYPEIKIKMYGNSSLNASIAYKNTPNARIGFYNDAFLNAWGDMGTFSVNKEKDNPVGTADYNYLSNETKYTPMSGETNGTNGTRTGVSNAIYEMELAHWSFLNRDYHTTVWNQWKNSTEDYNTILKRLGYRFVLKNSTFQNDNSQLSININLKNIGFARLFKGRKVYLILKNSVNSETFSFELDSDPRTWEDEVMIEQNIDIQSLPIGDYNSYLYLPDISSSIKDRTEYAIQFANENCWDNVTGYNNLNQQVVKNITTLNKHSTQKKLLDISFSADRKNLFVKTNISVHKGELNIYNMNGLLVSKTTNLAGAQFQISISKLTSGSYIIQLFEEKNLTQNKFFIY